MPLRGKKISPGESVLNFKQSMRVKGPPWQHFRRPLTLLLVAEGGKAEDCVNLGDQQTSRR